MAHPSLSLESLGFSFRLSTICLLLQKARKLFFLMETKYTIMLVLLITKSNDSMNLAN